MGFVIPQQIRPLEPADWPAVWQVLEPVFRAGETFPHDPAITQARAHDLWVGQTQAVLVAVDGTDAIVGTYYLKPNSLCQHSLREGRRLGFVDAHVMFQSLVEVQGS